MTRARIISFAALFVSGAVGAATALALQSCADADASTAESASVEPISPRYEDIQHGVECYELPLSTSLSCVKVR